MTTAVAQDILVFTSKNRSSGSAQSGVISSITPSLRGTYELLSFTMTGSVYNVETGVNDHLYFDADPNNDTVYEETANDATLTAGHYTPSELATEIATQMSSASAAGTFTCTYDSKTHKFTIAIDAGNFRWMFAANTTARGNLLVGEPEADDTDNQTSRVSTNVIDLNLHTHAVVRISEDRNLYVTSVPEGTNIESSFVVPLNEEFGSVHHHRSGQHFRQIVEFAGASSISYTLRDERGANLNNVGEFTVILRKLY